MPSRPDQRVGMAGRAHRLAVAPDDHACVRLAAAMMRAPSSASGSFSSGLTGLVEDVRRGARRSGEPVSMIVMARVWRARLHQAGEVEPGRVGSDDGDLHGRRSS